MKYERLQKIISQSGVTSRRKAEILILQGRVKVNGEVINKLGTKACFSDNITVDNIPITFENKVYYLFYKPRYVISTTKDEKNRKSVLDFFNDVSERIYPVGRLDYDASGILILTNDGIFSNLLMHPKYKINKKYIVKVKGQPQYSDLKKLHKPMFIKHKKVMPAKVHIISINKTQNTSILSIIIHQGINHQIKLMLANLGFPVIKIKREGYAFLTLKGLQPGHYRILNSFERQRLINLANKSEFK